MWGLLSRGKSRVAEAWAGLCPLPPARAGPEVSQPPGLDPKGDLTDRAGTLGSDLQANGGVAIRTPKWRRRLRRTLSYRVIYFYSRLPLIKL